MYDSDIKTAKTIGVGALVIILIITILAINPFGTIDSGEIGLRTKFGAITGETVEPGFYTRTPFVESVRTVNVKVQKSEVTVTAASKDLQSVTSVIAVNYSVDPAKAVELYRSVGDGYTDRLIAPAIQESVKSSTSNYTAEELITKREVVRDDIKSNLVDKLQGYGIVIGDLNIIDFDFSESFNRAIEEKVTAEQNALASKNKLQQIEYEAQQAVATAKGRAESMRIEAEALKSNPALLQLKYIEKWDGKLPTVQSSATPLLNLDVVK